MKKNILTMAALLIASATVFTACSNDDDSIINEPQPAQGTKTYTMTINASKGGDATTRALSPGRNDDDTKNVLNATWDENEVVLVYQNGSQIGTLRSAASTTNETTLTGTLDSAPNAGQDLTLYFHTNATPSYAGQDGTLAKIASTYDFCAPATITAGNFTVSGSTVSTNSSASFGANQQAIVKFTLIDKADGTTPLSASQLVINDGTTDYTITPASATSVIYAAIPGFSGQTVTLTATVGDDTYTYEKASQSFTNGQYYEITVKMTKQAAPAYTLLSAATTTDYGKVVCADGHLHTAKTAVPDGCTAVGILGKVTTKGHGLVLALQDATNQTWHTINGWESLTDYAGTTLKVLPDDAARGSLTSYTTLGSTAVSNWTVGQKGDYEAIFLNLGSKTEWDGWAYDGNVNAYITTGVGGTAMSGGYWSATESEMGAWGVYDDDDYYWGGGSDSGSSMNIRPVLGF